MVFSDKHLERRISWKHLRCCCVAGSRGKQHDSHKGRLSAMSTSDAATATLIADRYLRQHLNTTAFSHTWRSWKGHSSGIQIYICTHRQELLPSFILTSFLECDIYWAQQRWPVVLPLQQGAGQGHQGLLVPHAHQNALCAGGAALFHKVSTACDRELLQKLPSIFCTQIESGLFRAGKKCSSRTRTEVTGLGLTNSPSCLQPGLNTLVCFSENCITLAGHQASASPCCGPSWSPQCASGSRRATPHVGSASLHWEPLKNNIIFTLPSFEADPFTTSFSIPNT